MTPKQRTPQQRDKRFARVRRTTQLIMMGSAVTSAVLVGYAANASKVVASGTSTPTTSVPHPTVTTTPSTTTTTRGSTSTTVRTTTPTTVYVAPTTAPVTTTTVCTSTPSGQVTCN
ncbi:MAG: hypothetical protein ABI298_00055 [Acidimicrobiales bacterium]